MLDRVDPKPLARARAITPDEVAFYRENGWVHLKGLIAETEAAQVLETIQQGWREEPGKPHGGSFSDLWEIIQEPSRKSAALEAFTRSPELGDAAATLLGEPVRYWQDEILAKAPAGQAASRETPWHQDHPYTPFDRSGRPQFWIALGEITPEMGSLIYLSGSHRSGVLGQAFHDRSETMKRRLEALIRDYPRSPPMHLRPGDAAVHDGMTIHCSYPNNSALYRWAYVVQFFTADALYNGAKSPFSDNIGLKIGQPFDHSRFPIVGHPRLQEEGLAS